jgi:predicted nicotinamide N-methyase
MLYPIQLTQISSEKAIYVPIYEQVKDIYASLLNLDPNTPFPFWAKLWPSSIALLDVLKAHPHLIQNKHVLEIGAGIGLPSLMMAPITKSIQISDHDLEAVALLQKNIEHLQLQNAEALQLDWNNIPKNMNPDVVILSDVNYDPTQFDCLVALIDNFIQQGCTIILSTPQRIMASPFVQKLEASIIERHEAMVDENGIRKEISILVLSK